MYTKIKELAIKYGGENIYYTQVFVKHLLIDHNIDINQYFTRYCQLTNPVCPCGICNQELNPVIKGANFRHKKYACGRNPGQTEWSQNAKETRKGKNNPMYGQRAWNLGLTADTSDTMKLIAIKRTGQKVSKESKAKMSKSAKDRLIHGHTGHKHSLETLAKLRENTLKLIKDGRYKHTASKPHLMMRVIIDGLNIPYTEEEKVGYWSFDFYLPNQQLYIEVDGDYFHSNPYKWKDGPKSKTQKKNWTRDIKKNQYCVDNNMSVVRFWEYDIINNQQEVICKLKKLLELKDSVIFQQ